ncbi:GGDEF domain-containing protein [Pseudoduganella lurida]|uniref:GGDEF domain-containing protein n=1 Tax=Pseudoduganella lurida TaxID=1036180 RepID=UPI001E39FC54|nr:GGDEF domain-containing protein [Pseudoduganella lurida]
MLSCLALAAPLPAAAQPALDAELAATRETVRFVPDDATRRLQAMEPAARKAPVATRAEFFYLYSIALRRQGELRRALALADELVAYGRQVRDDGAIAKGMLARTYSLYSLNNLPASHLACFEAEGRAANTRDMSLRVLTMLTAGQCRQEQGNYPAALAKLQAAVDAARGVKNDRLPLAGALNALAVLYTALQQYDKGWEVQAESLALARTLPSPGRLAIALNTEYGLAISSGDYVRARRALLDELAVERRLGARQMVAGTLGNLSDCYLKERDYARAASYAQQAVAAASAVKNTLYIATARINLGQAYINLGRLAEGKRQFEAGLAVYEKNGNKPELQSVLSEYGPALERAGDFAGAIDAYHRERRISVELFAAQRQKDVLELQQKYDTEKNQRQMEALRQENRVKSAELDNRRLQQRIWWLLAVVFALAAVIVGLLYRKVRHANAQLQVKNLELAQQSARDPLTGLYNRRHFQEFMRAHTQTDSTPAGALFLLDVDHFKQVNDTYGHAAGDMVLKMIAENLRVTLRETDMIVRWGGEEFLAFLPAVPRGGLEEVARRILHGISAQVLDHQGQSLRVNVSVGFAPFPLAPGGTPLSWERAVNLVDMALYLAKGNGRNRAYGLRGFANPSAETLLAVEKNLEHAWRAGFVDLAVVEGEAAPAAAPAAATQA